MSEKIKAIRGSRDRAEEVKNWLVNQGAKDFKTYNFKDEDNFYYVVNGTVNFVTDEYKNLVDIVELKPKLKVIRGVNSRPKGERIIAALENLGGRNINLYKGDADCESCYYINNENVIYWDTIYNLNKRYELEFIELPEKNIFENTIFENTYFGKAYKTRNGTKAIYWKYNYRHYLFIETGLLECQDDGRIYLFSDEETKFDIVGEWQESIEEEKLDELDKAFNECSTRQACGNDTDVTSVLSPNNACLKECFKRS